MSAWMIYGANGYTGELIARQAVKDGMTPVLAGRNEEAISRLAGELGLESSVFSLDDPGTVAEKLAGMELVLHCAGPFSKTSRQMVEGCLAAGTHYLDITGEIDVFEMIHAPEMSKRAADKGIVLCPGVGFDVIPTDCTAHKLKELMPNAVSLSLGFSFLAGMSPGTTKTMIEGLSGGSAERKDGKIVPFPMGTKKRTLDFGKGQQPVTAIPWGDVSTAYYTTKIPNITTWIPLSETQIRGARVMSLFAPVLGTKPVQKQLLKWVDRSAKGPDERARENAPSYIVGEAKAADGSTVTVRIKTTNAYTLTALGSLEVVRRMLGRDLPSGSFTPAGLFGSGLVESLEGSGEFEVVE
ncbi:saccharopine dehydrogenase family protein [Jeotgalibacillus haloalkalitolerans]|uniref:NAD(P)H-binding protein n=1 Tax=Jeotgalibacillus haloalkalitolerans TaxID=3104292 RepID=A0ABU5KHA2_9BACL|nr:NAD(P)H-binding protein [Jeotgalibacillus sp. HH7-29]MDZ5710633.1 NAD(P)H-binding protein [Jeotgalibacillus sp. HH7-29]